MQAGNENKQTLMLMVVKYENIARRSDQSKLVQNLAESTSVKHILF